MQQRPGSRDVTKSNTQKVIYLDGDEITDGSVRLFIDSNGQIMSVEKRIDGIFQLSGFRAGYKTIFVGRVGIANFGHHIVTEKQDGTFHFHATNEFDGRLSTKDTSIVTAFAFLERLVVQSDNSGTFTGNLFENSFTQGVDAFVQRRYFQTDTTAPTTPFTIALWEGTDDTGTQIFNQTYPASGFMASSEIVLDLDGYIELDKGVTYFFRMSSDTDFSLKTSASGFAPWIAIDNILTRKEEMLQVLPWITGDNFEVGQWAIQNKRIYECNVDGIQTGVFDDNSDKWDMLTSSLSGVNFDDIITENAGLVVVSEAGNILTKAA